MKKLIAAVIFSSFLLTSCVASAADLQSQATLDSGTTNPGSSATISTNLQPAGALSQGEAVGESNPVDATSLLNADPEQSLQLNNSDYQNIMSQVDAKQSPRSNHWILGLCIALIVLALILGGYLVRQKLVLRDGAA